MGIWFNCICRRKDLFHRISSHLKAPNNSISSSHKYENFDISKYIEIAEKLDIEVIPLGFGVYELRKGDITKRVTIGIGYDKQNLVSNYLCRNKYLTYEVLKNNSIKHLPKYQLYTFKDIRKTIRDFKEWNCPVVIKPCSNTYGGKGVAVNIQNIKELKNAIAESFIFDRKAYLMEQYITGSHFRVVTLNGKFVACSQRIPARVIGNGRDSIKRLFKKENQKRRNDRSEGALYPIIIDNEVRRKLKYINKSMGSILGKNEEIYVKDTVSLHSGGEVTNIENVSEEIKSICKKIANILDVYLAGFDIITSDISKPFSETKGVINEVNTAPGIDVMYKVTNYDTHVDIADIVLKDMFNL